MYMSNNYAAYLPLIQCYMSLKLGKKQSRIVSVDVLRSHHFLDYLEGGDFLRHL